MYRGSYKTNYPLQVLCVLIVWQLVNDVFERPTTLMSVGLVCLYFFSILYPLISRRMINTVKDLPEATPLAHDICLGRATRLDGKY